MNDEDIVKVLEQSMDGFIADTKKIEPSIPKKEATAPAPQKKQAKKEKNIEIEPTPKTDEEIFNDELRILKISRDDIGVMLSNFIDDGFIEESHLIFNKISIVLRTGTLKHNREIVDLFEGMNIKTEAAANYNFELATLSNSLYSYNGEKLPDSLGDRMNYIESLPAPIIPRMMEKASSFRRKVALISTERFVDFF